MIIKAQRINRNNYTYKNNKRKLPSKAFIIFWSNKSFGGQYYLTDGKQLSLHLSEVHIQQIFSSGKGSVSPFEYIILLYTQ